MATYVLSLKPTAGDAIKIHSVLETTGLAGLPTTKVLPTGRRARVEISHEEAARIRQQIAETCLIEENLIGSVDI